MELSCCWILLSTEVSTEVTLNHITAPACMYLALRHALYLQLPQNEMNLQPTFHYEHTRMSAADKRDIPRMEQTYRRHAAPMVTHAAPMATSAAPMPRIAARRAARRPAAFFTWPRQASLERAGVGLCQGQGGQVQHDAYL